MSVEKKEYEVRRNADEFYRESPTEEQLAIAHSRVIAEWNSRHEDWLSNVRDEIIQCIDVYPDEFETLEEWLFVLRKKEELETFEG